MAKGIKYDGEKWRFSLLPLEPVIEVIKVLELGAKKYSVDNWKFVKPVERYYDACMRHVLAYKTGEKKDPESGLSHLAHAVCCLLFMLWNDLTGGAKK